MATPEAMFYGIPNPRRTRTKDLKVLALGYTGSDTKALRDALKELGYDKTYHGDDLALEKPCATQAWVQLLRRKYGDSSEDSTITTRAFDLIIGHCEAVTDTPAALLAPELIAAYPDAKVILNVRGNVDEWYDSYQERYGAWNSGLEGWKQWARKYFCAELYWIMQCHEYTAERYFYNAMPKTGKWVYRQHAAVVRGSVPAERLLEWAVEDGWSPLCKFLGKDVPKGKVFPKGEGAVGFESGPVGGKTLEKWNRMADRNMSYVTAALFAFIAFVAFLVY